MNTLDRITIVEKCIARKREFEAHHKTLDSLFGRPTDGPLVDLMWRMFDDVTKASEERIGDSFGWISWFMWDNDCGAKGYTAKASSWKKPRKIKTVADLVSLVEADL